MIRSRLMAMRILRNRDLRRLFAAFLAFNAAEYATWIAILLFAYEATGPASVGVVAMFQLVPAALIAPAVAALGDRYPRDRVLVGAYLVYGIGLSVTAAAMLIGLPAVLVYVIAAIGTAALVAIRPTQSALLPALSQTPDELTSANGAAGIIEGVGIVLGPLAAAAVLTRAGPAAIFILGAITILGGAVLVMRLRVTPVGATDDSTGGRDTDLGANPGTADGLVSGLRVVIGDPDARVVVALMSTRMLMIGAADVLFVLMAMDLLGTGQAGAGILQAALGAGTIIGGVTSFLLMGRGRLASIAAAGACLWGVALATSGWLASPLMATILIVGGGAGLAIVDVAGRTILQRSIRDAVLARVFGIQEGLAMTALALGTILVPALIAIIGLTGAVLASAAILPIVVTITWSRLVSLDSRTPVAVQAMVLLGRVALFAPLPAPTLEAIARRATWETVPQGTTVIREGDVGDRYFVLASGAVLVERDGRQLRELTTPGDGFGEIALLRDVPRTATVTTMQDATFLTVDRQTFLAAVTGNPHVLARAESVVASATM
jgi:hypothetical protein